MKNTKGNVVIKIDLHQKEKYKLSNGVEIYLARGYEYNLRLDNPNVAEVISAEKIPTGALVLIHHNATQESYKIFEEKGDIYSIPEDLVFLYFYNGEWLPNVGFVISQRIFKPYLGFLVGIENELLKNRMWIVKGEYANKCVVTLDNCDYCIIFFIEGKEYQIIRTRIREIIAEDVELGGKIKNGEYLIGINSNDSKTLT